MSRIVVPNSNPLSKLSKSARLGRRSFLRAAGATAATLPFLSALPGYAQSTQPKLILAFSGNGRIRHLWGGVNDPSGLQLRQNLAPLQPWAKYITLAEGLHNPSAGRLSGTHEGGTKTLFTGGGNGSVSAEGVGAAGPSIDTLFMAQQSGTAKNNSFYQQVVAERNSAENAGPNNRIVFDETGSAREPYRSGWEAVDGYLADVVSSGPATAPSEGPNARDLARTKLFESLNAQLGELEGRLCAEDYYQMGAMREAVAKAGNSMQAVVSCELPELPPRPDLPDYEPIWQPPQKSIDLQSTSDWYYLRGRLAVDLMVMSLACGVTRSGVLQFDQSAGEAQAVGHPATHHNQSHETPTSLQPFLVDHAWVSEEDPFYRTDYQFDPPAGVRSQYQASWDLLSEWELYYADHMAYLLSQLESFGLLADTAVLWGSEIDLGGAHNHMSMPLVLVSGDNLPFTKGKSIQYEPYYDPTQQDIRPSFPVDAPRRNHNDLLRTVLNGLGVDATAVGTTDDNLGEMPEILG